MNYPMKPEYTVSSPSFIRMVAVMVLLANLGRIGRYRLGRLMGVGEGEARGLLKYLIDHSYAEPARGGTRLTAKGLKYYHKAMGLLGVMKIVFLDISGILPFPQAPCIQVGGVQTLNVLALRDECVRHGAEGALVMRFSGNRLSMPGVSEDLSTDYPSLYSQVMSRVAPGDGDLLIMPYGRPLGRVVEGGLWAALKAIKQVV